MGIGAGEGRATLGLLSLVAAVVAGIASPLFFAIVLSAGLVIVVIRALFPTGRLFPIAFAGIDCGLHRHFLPFVEDIFHGVDAALLAVGFCLPIFFFVVGCWLRRVVGGKAAKPCAARTSEPHA